MDKAARQIALTVIVTLLAALLAACDRGAAGNTGASDTAVAATVNGKNISLKEVDTIINQQTGGQQSKMSQLELAAARLQVLENLIQQEVLFQRAEKEKLLPSEEEVTQAINQLKRRANMTEEEWQKTLQENNRTEQSLREEQRKQIAIQKLQEKVVGKISISDREVESYYNNNKAQFVNARGVGLSAVIVDPRDNGYQDDAKSEPEAKLKIERLATQLKTGGADFATVARASSEDQTNLRGGDLGFATEDDLRQNGFPQELINQFFNPDTPIGSYAGPVTFNGRWYIFKLTNRQLANENLTLDSPGVRDKIKEALVSQRQQLLNAALVATAMHEAKIQNNLALDMLNSPNNLSGLRPADTPAASPAASPSPAATASPGAASGSPTASPQGR